MSVLMPPRPRRRRREAERQRKRELDELFKSAGIERCYRYDDSLNCTRTKIGTVEIQDSHSVHRATMQRYLGSSVKTFSIPRTKKASEILRHGAGPWNDHVRYASTGRWSCNEHDHVFGPTDTDNPDEQDPEVALLLMLKAALQESWHGERELQIRTALAESGQEELREEFKSLAENARERTKIIRPITDQLVMRLIHKDYQGIKSGKMLIEGAPTTIGTSVEARRNGDLIVMTLIPTDTGHKVIWCWMGNAISDAIAWLFLKGTKVAPKHFVTNMFLRSPHNIFVEGKYYRQSMEAHEAEIIKRICSRHAIRERLQLNSSTGFSVLG